MKLVNTCAPWMIVVSLGLYACGDDGTPIDTLTTGAGSSSSGGTTTANPTTEPATTDGPKSRPSTYTRVPVPPPLNESWPLARNATTFTAMIAMVTTTESVPARARTVAAVRTFVFSPAHSGQRMPTGVGVMQDGQIGRPQLEQETFVSRSGWR